VATEAAAFGIRVIGMIFAGVRRFVLLLAAGVFAVGVVGPASGVAARSSRAACKSPTSQPPKLPRASALAGVAVTPNCEAWAVGVYSPRGPQRNLIMHWNGTAWKDKTPRRIGRMFTRYGLTAVAATSANNVWAVGDFNILHWNGTTWRFHKSARVGVLTGVATTSSKNAWAVGSGTLIDHWNGKAWAVQTAPAFRRGNNLTGVAATSSTNAWAVGFHGGVPGDAATISSSWTYRTLIEHWNGRVWKAQKSLNPGGTGYDFLYGVAATSPTNAWAVGNSGASGVTGLIEHWNGKAWKVQKSPTLGPLFGVTATSSTNAWAVGYYNQRQVILHWNGKAWKVQKSPHVGHSDNILKGVAASSSKNAWAVGYSGRYRSLAMHWNGTAWGPR
jgi:hypothetical protein